MLGKLFGKKGREARAAMQVVQNRDLMQAIVYGAFYVAAADGDIGDDEIKKTEKLIANTPQLKGFGPELSNTMDRAEKDFHDGGHRILRMNAEGTERPGPLAGRSGHRHQRHADHRRGFGRHRRQGNGCT